MFNSKKMILLFSILFIAVSGLYGQNKKQIIYLSWKNVVDISRKDNLSLKSKSLDNDIQNLETWKSLSYFLPNLSYTAIMQKNVELPVFVFMGQSFVVGTPYNFQHSLILSLPLFTGGSRWYNYDIQKSIQKSLSEELKGKEEETVLNSIQAYFGIILANELMKSASEAVTVAEKNLDPSQYTASLPVLESASSNKKLSVLRLKSLLNIPLTDSLVVTDKLSELDFLKEYKAESLENLKLLAHEFRNDLKSLKYQNDVVKSGEKIALGKFAPTISISASVDQAAQLENSKIRWDDYIRSKSITLSMNWPLFEGGRKVIDYQIAKIKSDQMDLLVKQSEFAAELDIEQNYYGCREATKNLQSLEIAVDQYKESMRISNILYAQGMTNQLDVLNAQLLYTKSKSDYLYGIYNYNVSQLNLLKSIGLLHKIWN